MPASQAASSGFAQEDCIRTATGALRILVEWHECAFDCAISYAAPNTQLGRMSAIETGL